MEKQYYRHSYLKQKKLALEQYKILMRIALKNKNRELFLKYNQLVDQLQFEFTQALIG